MSFSYKAKQNVLAAQWRDGKTVEDTNLQEMGILLKDVVGWNEYAGIEVFAELIEPYYVRSGSGGGYHMLKFYAGDDMEVDPGQWVVVYEDGEVEIMEDQQFHRLFEKS